MCCALVCHLCAKHIIGSYHDNVIVAKHIWCPNCYYFWLSLRKLADKLLCVSMIPVSILDNKFCSVGDVRWKFLIGYVDIQEGLVTIVAIGNWRLRDWRLELTTDWGIGDWELANAATGDWRLTIGGLATGGLAAGLATRNWRLPGWWLGMVMIGGLITRKWWLGLATSTMTKFYF